MKFSLPSLSHCRFFCAAFSRAFCVPIATFLVWFYPLSCRFFLHDRFLPFRKFSALLPPNTHDHFRQFSTKFEFFLCNFLLCGACICSRSCSAPPLFLVCPVHPLPEFSLRSAHIRFRLCNDRRFFSCGVFTRFRSCSVPPLFLLPGFSENVALQLYRLRHCLCQQCKPGAHRRKHLRRPTVSSPRHKADFPPSRPQL